MDAKLKRILERLRAGDTPRCSRKQFDALFAVLPGQLQLESRYGSDTSGGYVLTPLQSAEETNNAIINLMARWPQT